MSKTSEKMLEKDLKQLNYVQAQLLLEMFPDEDKQRYIFQHLDKQVALRIIEENCKLLVKKGILEEVTPGLFKVTDKGKNIKNIEEFRKEVGLS